MQETRTFFESTGLILRKVANIIWFFLPLILIIFALIVSAIIPDSPDPEFPPIEIEAEGCYILEYYEYLEETTCELEITFNQNVYSGRVTVAFYDVNGYELETLSIDLNSDDYWSYGTTMVNTYFTVEGKVDSYEIIDYSEIESAELDLYYDDIDNSASIFGGILGLWIFIRGFYVIPLALTSLFFSCKTYRVGEHVIVVYAGRMKHYIKIDGQKYDEKNALISFSAIKLNATMETGEQIEVYIPSFTKRISLRVNGVLETPTTF